MTNSRVIATIQDLPDQTQRGFPDGPTPRRSRATLRTLDDVAVELAKLYRRAESGQIPTADASRLAYILTSLGKMIEASVIETRLTALEAIVDEKN